MTEKIGLESVFETDQFQKGLGTYLKGIKTASISTDLSAASIGKSLAAGIASIAWDGIKIGAAALVGLGTAAAGAAVGLGVMFMKSVDAAGALVDLSAKTGLSVETLQELSFIGDQIGVSSDTMTGSLAKLTRAMNSARDGTGAQADAFKTLGISVKNQDGSLRDARTVWLESIKALGQIQNETDRDAVAMQLFGRSAQDLNPLIKTSASELEAMTKQAHDMGAIMSTEDATALDNIGDKMSAFGNAVKGIAGRIAGKFVPAATQMVNSIEKFASSKQFQEIIGKIADAVGVFADKISLIIGLLANGFIKSALDTAFGPGTTSTILGFVAVINQVIATLTPFAAWLSANWMPIAAGIATVVLGFIVPAFIAWAGAAIAAAIATITALAPVVLPILAIGAAVGLLVAAWNGNWGGIRDTLTTIWTGTLLPILTQVWNWLSTNLPLAISALSTFWTTVLLPALTTVWSWISTNLIPLFEAIGRLITTVVLVAAQELSTFWTTTLGPAFQSVADIISGNVQPVFDQIAKFITETAMPVFERVAAFVGGSVAEGFNAVAKAIAWVIGKINDLVLAFQNLENNTPADFKPGSPTPFEIGMTGIGKAVKDLASVQLPKLTASLQMDVNRMSPVMATAAGSTPAVTNNRVTNNTYNLGQNNINSGLDAGVFEARVLDIVRRNL